MKDTIAKKLASHFGRLQQILPELPEKVEWLLPLAAYPESNRVFNIFLEKYYSDRRPRTLILGINPGRFGAGVTNVAFTDPVHLERACNIPNDFPKREELSARFVYKVIHAFGSVEDFYGRFFISSVVPFGFVKAGKNYNYYDEKPLQNLMEPFAAAHIEGLLALGMNPAICFCLGEGKNFKFLSALNERAGFFKKIVPLPHPRFIMQYKRKQLDSYLEQYMGALRLAI